MSIGEPHVGARATRKKSDFQERADGTVGQDYVNPIIHADYSDPDVIRHGDDYYLTASSFNCTPGLPILHSRDLVHWTIVNHALKNLPGSRFDQVQPGCGVWAPSIRFHDGKFWIFFAMPDEGIYHVTASDPTGEWSAPHLVQAGKGLIDPCPFWDDDGRAYLVHAYAHSRSGIRDRLHLRPMAADGSRLVGDGKIVFENSQQQPTIEGPKFLKKDGWYYILAPAGGVATGWQSALRSRRIDGPYEARVVLEQGATSVNGPHQGALVETAAGEWWFFHFQDAGPYGRIVHLQPATWKDGWPLMGIDQDGNGIGEPVSKFRRPQLDTAAHASVPQSSDEFDSQRIGLQWQWNANHSDEWYSLSAEPGWLRLHARPAPNGNLHLAPHLLLQKFPAPAFTATTRLRLPQTAATGKAGLIVMGQTHAGLLVSHAAGALKVERIDSVQHDPGRSELTDSFVTTPAKEIILRVDVREGAECRFSFSLDGGKFQSLGDSFPATPGTWIGAKVGIVALGDESHADFDYFRIS